MNRVFSFIITFIWLLTSTWLEGATYYISPTGSNGAAGSLAAPWQTLTYASTHIAGGDTLYMRGGTYTNDWEIHSFPSGASWSTPTAIKAYPGETPIIRPNTTSDIQCLNLTSGSYISIEGIEIDMSTPLAFGAALKITEAAHHIQVTNCHIHHIYSGFGILLSGGTIDNGADNHIFSNTIHHAGWQHQPAADPDHAIYVKTPRNVIAGNTLYSNQSHAIHLFSGSPHQNVVSGNRMWANDTGIAIYSGSTNWVYNNIGWSNTGYCFVAGYNSSHTYFANNTAWRNGVNFATASDMVTNAVFENCLSIQGTNGIDSGGFYIRDSAKGVTVRYCQSTSNTLSNFRDPSGVCVTNNNRFGDAFNVAWANPAAANFALTAASVGWNTGVTVPYFTTDILGVTRPQYTAWDMGAYELSPVGPSTYYIDWVSGSDANSGLTTSTPWKRHPYMKGFTGAYTHVAGDTFVFKGGVTWPVTAFQMKLTAGGNASARDTYTSDPSWYSGGSWSRPVFDFENTTVGSGWEFASGVFVAADYITIANIEMKRHRGFYSGQDWGASTIILKPAGGFILTNCVVKDWSIPTPGAGQDGGGSGGLMDFGGGTGGNAIISGCTFSQASALGGVHTGRSSTCYGTYEHCTFDSVTIGIMGGGTVRGCAFSNFTTPTDPNAHGNVIYCFGPSDIYANLIHDTPTAAQVIYPSPNFNGLSGVTRIANNIVYNTAQPPITFDMEGPNSSGCSALIYNNTLVAPGGTGYCIRMTPRSGQAFGSLDIRNNHLITTGNPYCINNAAGSCGTVNTVTTLSNLTQTVSQASGLGYTAGNLYAPLDATKPTYNTGSSGVSSTVTTDYLGISRPQAVLYDIGAYEFAPSGPSPGTLVLSAASASVSESAGSITVTARRTGGTSGVVSCSYATANGTATNAVNYTSTSGTFSWTNGDSADKSISVPIINASTYGNLTFTFTLSSPTGSATLGTPSTQTITINGVGSPPITPLPGLSWAAPSGVIAPPFTTNVGGYISQALQTTDPTQGGVATYYFTNAPGHYAYYVVIDAPNDSANSIFFQVNGTPQSPSNIFDVVTFTSGAEERAVSQRNNGTFDAPQVLSYQTDLLGGVTNRIVIIGREAGVKLYNVEARLLSAATNAPTILSVTTTNVDGGYKAGAVLGLSVMFSTNVTVTGTPTLALNSGGIASYVSGSGTPTLLFQQTVATFQNTQSLDYTATNSLALAGGTIKNATTDALLTLSPPGTPGSASYGRLVVVDTIRPQVTISAPSATLAATGASIFYTVTYLDFNFTGSNLRASDITLNRTGTANATVSTVSGFPYTTSTVTLNNLTGSGTLGITVAANTATDLAGNSALGAGPSTTATVTRISTMNVITLKAGTITTRP